MLRAAKTKRASDLKKDVCAVSARIIQVAHNELEMRVCEGMPTRTKLHSPCRTSCESFPGQGWLAPPTTLVIAPRNSSGQDRMDKRQEGRGHSGDATSPAKKFPQQCKQTKPGPPALPCSQSSPNDGKTRHSCRGYFT
eukprot:571640-Hanusia_phi.AAC.6